MRDAVLFGALVVAFATLCTAHVFIAVRLALHQPRYRGLVALVLPPLAAVWAYQNRWRMSLALWLAATAAYAVALTLAYN
jgi:hypothetical protein